MPTKKKKKVSQKKPKPPQNPLVFKWSTQRKKAALLLSEGTKNIDEVWQEVGVNERTLFDWRRHPIFQAEVSRLTLENEKATREGLLRIAYKAIEKKIGSIADDRSTVLEWTKFIAELQGHTKQKIELDANMKHSAANYAEMTDEELQQALNDELSKLATKGNSSGTDSN